MRNATATNTARNASATNTARNGVRGNTARNGIRGNTARNATRALAAAAVALGVLGAGSATASAKSIEGEIEPWSPVEEPAVKAPTYEVPTARDLVRDRLPEAKLPEGYTFPDDDADPEPAVPEPEPDTHGVDVDPERFVVDDDALDRLDVGDIERVIPGGEVEPGNGCDDPDFAEEYPEKCPQQEPQGDPEDGSGEPCGPNDGEDCDEPGDEPADDPEDETTVTTTTVSEETADEPEVEVESASEEAAEELAYTGSSPLVPLLGIGLVGAGAAVAGLSIVSRRRSGSQAEA